MKKVSLILLGCVTLFCGACNSTDEPIIDEMQNPAEMIDLTDIVPSDNPVSFSEKRGGKFLCNVGFICTKVPYGIYPEYDTRLERYCEDAPETRYQPMPFDGIYWNIFTELKDGEYVTPTVFTSERREFVPGYKNIRLVGCVRVKNQYPLDMDSYSSEVFEDGTTEYTDPVMGKIIVTDEGYTIDPTPLNEYLQKGTPEDLGFGSFRVKTPYSIHFYLEGEPTPGQAERGYKVARCEIIVIYYPIFTA